MFYGGKETLDFFINFVIQITFDSIKDLFHFQVRIIIVLNGEANQERSSLIRGNRNPRVNILASVVNQSHNLNKRANCFFSFQKRQDKSYPRANGAKRRSGHKPGARVTNSAQR